MSVLLWDQTGERVYETGVDKGVLYTEKETVAGSNKAFKHGVAWNGVTGITESPSGAEANDIYADNIKYATLRSAETFGATIEAYTYPDEFAECDGSAEPVAGVRIGQQSRKPFGLSYRTDIGDDTDSSVDPDNNYKLHMIWNATASPSEKAYTTINESPEAITFSWELSTTPIAVPGYKPTASMEINTTKLTTEGRTRLALLEDILYGTSETDPYLPTPEAVIRLMRTGSIEEVVVVEEPQNP